MLRHFILINFALIFCINLIAGPIDPVKLLDEVEQAHRAQSSFATIEMLVENSDWTRKLVLKAWSLGDDYTLIRIVNPKKDKGVSTLRRKSDMWNYFPKINREIKIPPSMMMGSWMGSDFTNDDLVKQAELADLYTVTLKEMKQQYILTLIPKVDTATVWGRIEYTIDSKSRLTEKQLFYDEKGERVRQLTFSDNKVFSGKLLPSKMQMISFDKPGNRTTVIYQELTLNLPIKTSFFSLHNLKKVK